MAQLDTLLAEAYQTHDEMQAAARGEDGAEKIVRLRTRFATLVAQLLGAIAGDQRLANDRALKAEFEGRFFDMRQALGQHQSRWRGEAIDADFAGYRLATRELGRTQDAFYAWARSALDRA